MKKHLYALLFACLLPLWMKAGGIGVYDLRVENQVNPLGLDVSPLRFSWKIASEKKNTQQTSWHILVASSKDKLQEGVADLWDSGKVESEQQLWIDYAGKRLADNQHAWWKVRISTNKGKSEWSQPQHFSIGLLGETHWRGRWIGLEDLQKGDQRGMHTRLAARYLRREFKARVGVRRATAFVAGFGLYEFYVNGTKIGHNEVLRPVPADFRKTVYYNTYDITQQLRQGNNALGVTLEAGRVFPPRQEKPSKTPYFGLPKCRINVIVEYTDGKKDTWVTDEKWKVTTAGPIRCANEYDGEEYDARMEMDGWNRVGFDDSQWIFAQRAAIPEGTLRAQPTPNMVMEPLGKPVATHRTEGGIIVDFGQNMAGWMGVKVRGNRGDSIRIRYAERLDAKGNLYTDNLRNARSEDIYVCNGNEQGREWHASFVYHGFRYAQVSGLPEAKADDFMAYTVDDPMETTGHLVTSDTLLNHVLKNAWWGIKSNYKGMPVDCPQRNERQPWLGDRTVGCLGESFLFNNERLYAKWMADLRDGVRSDGALSNVTPAFWNYYEDNMTWPAVFPLACDMLYEQYGNAEPIVTSYPYIRKWLTHMLNEYERDGIITKDKYGDWCVPPEKLTITHSNDPTRQTDGKLISTAYGIGILRLMEKFAPLAGHEDDVEAYREKRKTMTEAFNRTFLTYKRGTSPRPGHVLYPDSVFYGNNTATANLLPLAFGIVPDSIKQEVVKNLVTNIITKGGGHVTCGVVGISWLLRGLSNHGFADVAYLLATQKTYPSWGYMAENGATTIWELWNGDKANPSMNSGNHVMLLGDLLTWCYQYLGGIRQAEGSTAYKHLVLSPSFDIEDCFSTDASFETPYGLVKSCWRKNLQKLHWEIMVPAGSKATVCLPGGKTVEVGSGSYVFDTDIPTSSPAIKTDEFLYDFAPFPQAHASTIAELKNGDLVAAYFGGTRERNPDVCIWVSRKPKGAKAWESPILAADGVFALGTADDALAGKSGIDTTTTTAFAGPIKDMPDYTYNYARRPTTPELDRLAAQRPELKRKACWNPVLFAMPNDELILFYKVGTTVGDWQGCMVKSTDGGRTWGPREMLPKGFIGPVKNKPELIDNQLVCASSTEGKWWTFHVELFNPKTGTWKFVGPIEADSALLTDDGKMHPIKCIQPSILRLADGRLKVLMRTHNGKLAESYSHDGGASWSRVELSDIPNNQSGTDAVTLNDGRHALVYNNFETIMGTPKGVRTPLSLALSADGEHFSHTLTLEDSPISQYSYPAIIEGRDGSLHVVYTWRRERIAYKNIKLK